MDIRFSERIQKIRPSAIRNKLFDNPDIITFAAGKPEQSLFPISELAPLAENMIKQDGPDALQYGSTEGLPRLRELIAGERMQSCGVSTDAHCITLTSGSQEGIELSARVFVNEGDGIACESPSYTGAFSAFEPYSPRYIPIPMDENGMIMEDLEAALKTDPHIKMIYTIPDFQNPTGIAMSDDRRRRLAELAAEYRVPVIEDCPYGDLIYEGFRHPSVKSFDQDGWVVTLGSFSKTLCPGLRLGWICAAPEILEKYALAKQALNLQCGTFDQYLAAAYLERSDLDLHIEEIKDLYRQRRDLMLNCIKEYFPLGIVHTRPGGGFFIWVETHPRLDTETLLLEAAAVYKVAYVPGHSFFADDSHANFIRLSYSFVDLAQIREGMERLGSLLCKKYKELQ